MGVPTTAAVWASCSSERLGCAGKPKTRAWTKLAPVSWRWMKPLERAARLAAPFKTGGQGVAHIWYGGRERLLWQAGSDYHISPCGVSGHLT